MYFLRVASTHFKSFENIGVAIKGRESRILEALLYYLFVLNYSCLITTRPNYSDKLVFNKFNYKVV